MYELILKFSPEKLFEEFAEQYVVDHGNSKLEKIAEIVHSSVNINIYIQNVIENKSIPNADNLQYVLNTHNFFLFSKEETICLAGLSIILKWSNMHFMGSEKDQENLVIKIMAQLIDKCARLKYNQFNGFFQRLERRLRLQI